MATDHAGRYVLLRSAAWSIPKIGPELMGVKNSASSQASVVDLWLSVWCESRTTCHVAVAGVGQGSNAIQPNIATFQSGTWNSHEVVESGAPIWSIRLHATTD